jgi:hypothetical protein
VRAAAWDGLSNLQPAAAARQQRRDEIMPPLAAGSLIYWFALLIAGLNEPLALSSAAWMLAGSVWLGAVLAGAWLLPWLPFHGGAEVLVLPAEDEARSRLRSGAWLVLRLGIWLAAAWLLVTTWGWWRGGLVWLLLLWGIRGGLHLALAWLLAYLPLFMGIIPTTPEALLATTGLALLAMTLLALLVPRWGRFGVDRPDGLVLLGGGLGALMGSLLAGQLAETAAAWEMALILGLALALGRRWARQPSTYSGSADLLPLLADFGRTMWDLLDQISLQLKPMVGGIAGGAWAAVLVQASTILAPGPTSAWSLSDSLWLGTLLGLGLWLGNGTLWRALLLPALGGAVGGWLAQGMGGAIVGAGIGLGLGMGEWLAAQ